MNDLDLLKLMNQTRARQSKSFSGKESDTATAIQPEVKSSERPQSWILALKTGIAGMQFYVEEDMSNVKSSLEPGTELVLKRDYKNEHDPWAIAIHAPSGEMLGYMTRYKNETIARLMDVGRSFHAIIDKPVELPKGLEVQEKYGAPTENYDLPYSVYMEDETADDEEAREV